MQNRTQNQSLGKYAFIAGMGAIFMGGAPYAEYFVYFKLIVPGNGVETVHNILGNKALFVSGLFGYLLTYITDVVVAWALYILLKPVDENLSILTAWFRLVYTIIALAALLQLVTVLRLLDASHSQIGFEKDQLIVQVMHSLYAFRDGWSFSLSFFGIHLGLLGYLVYKSGYIPKILGVLLIIAGVSWVLNGSLPLMFPGISLDFLMIGALGEFVFMFWLIVRGKWIKEKE